MNTENLTGKILMKLDEPSSVITENTDIAEEFYYAVIADSIKDLDQEGTMVLTFYTKEDFDNNKGTLTYMTPCMFENPFEYTTSII